MKKTFLVITSIANSDHAILRQLAAQAKTNQMPFIVVGDTKSPDELGIESCDFYSIARQESLGLKLAKDLPKRNYARKNLGYLVAISQGAETIIETDDDNIPQASFWQQRTQHANAHLLTDTGWVNVYKYFTDQHIWPRGFSLNHLQSKLPELGELSAVDSPIQQGLVDDDPDVDAIYRLVLSLSVKFDQSENVALGAESFCPFNSQNTTWFKAAFFLLYLPSYCSFRMTDIWRSFIAQRIAWTCNWSGLFHKSSARQERNEHNFMDDFKDEVIGYINNDQIYIKLKALDLKQGAENIPYNMRLCYQMFIDIGVIEPQEMNLLEAWFEDMGRLLR